MPLHACHSLHRQAFQLAADADQLASEASEMAMSTEQCLQNLEDLTQRLKRSVLQESTAAALQESELDVRGSVLKSDRALQAARMASAEPSNGPTWEALYASRRAALLQRIALAEARRAAAEEEAKVARLETMNRLAELHRYAQRQRDAVTAVNWRAEFEAFVCKQRAHADGLAAENQNETTAKLAESLASATSAVNASTPDMRKYMQNLLGLIRVLAESECRRRGLLMTS